jgi:site-specific DNA recombinase
MDKPTRKPLRCAIYTRKSTEHNLDLEFNSLDAQREACEAYIKSQAHEGWRLIPDRYDDGGLSGASLDRPALQTLLADVRARKIDVVVVYKVDRLTRSLADFAKLVELFDQHSVSFVSVTQSFNTTSSMGRLTLNVLLSFAQFEREVIGERVRDKIAASKRKGTWVGGPVPLGYAAVNKKVVIVPEEAETVRMIFRRYLEVPSIGDLARELDRRGIRTKRQVLSNGRDRGGCRFGVGPLAHVLKNRFYIGEVLYRGEIHCGEHEAILDRETFEAVQRKLASNTVARDLRLKSSPAVLAGRIFDDRGNGMTPTHTIKKGVRYRYYVSHAILQKRNQEAGTVIRVPAAELERLVVQAVRHHSADQTTEQEIASDRDLVEHHIERIVIRSNAVQVCLVEPKSPPTDENISPQDQGAQRQGTAPTTSLTLPWNIPEFRAVKGIVHAPAKEPGIKPETRHLLLVAIAKARTWVDDLVQGRVHSLAEIARREGKVERHIRLLAPLAFVSPSVLQKIVEGSAPGSVTVTGLARALAYSWAEQERRIECAATPQACDRISQVRSTDD